MKLVEKPYFEKFLTHSNSQVRQVATILSSFNLDLQKALRSDIYDLTEKKDTPSWGIYVIWTNDIRFTVETYVEKNMAKGSRKFHLHYINYNTDDSLSISCSKINEFENALKCFLLPFTKKYFK